MDGFLGKQQESAGNEAESEQGEDRSAARHQTHLDTCPVCHLNFHSREPQLLPCLHSFCKKCLPPSSRNLATTQQSSSGLESATRTLNVIRCPVCRQECMAVDVMDNVFAKDSAEAPSSSVERTVQICMTCDDNAEAAGFCVDCAEYLCAICVEAHRRVKFTKDHIIRQITEVHGVSAQTSMLCNIHRQEPLKLFCETCDLLTCRDCQLSEHKDHNYQFIEDAFNNHKQHMETMTHQLQEKKKQIEDVSNSINNELLLVEKNCSSVHNEIEKSICSAILEIKKNGKVLFNQLETVAKDHERVLRKQQEDTGYLSRHLDYVISFIKWAAARDGGMALLHCKRLIFFQIKNLLQAKPKIMVQSAVRFQCRGSYWASDVDLGSLVVESVPGHRLGGFPGMPPQLSIPGQDSSESRCSFVLEAPRNTLAQLQMQVDSLNSQTHRQPQSPPPPWTWYQSVPLQPTVPGARQGPFSCHRSMVPPSSHVSSTSSLPNPGLYPQHLVKRVASSFSQQTTSSDVSSSSSLCTPFLPVSRGVGLPQALQMNEFTCMNKKNSSDDSVCTVRPIYPLGHQPSPPSRRVQARQNPPEYAFVPREEKPGTSSWNSSEMHHDSGTVRSVVKKRRRSSPEPILVIKDEPVDGRSYISEQ
ncbi:transcription intermediary factor 1-alpha-like [Cololabis saira]|uniref:transcription intermediary factor 1-alpha-like n=1 Tax=Cololabis saira TaxID=129043 RepID=UPI002AD4695A|nr:transcription intermediary factor 1-alpha-like [Cololabis saira]